MQVNPVIEGNQLDRPAAVNHTLVLHHAEGQTIRAHSHPAWNVVVPLAGQINWSADRGPGRRAAGAVFPPNVAYRSGSGARHSSVFIDPWHLGLGPGSGRPIALDVDSVRHLRAIWSPDQVADPDESARATVVLLRRRDLLPAPVAIDPRVVAALRDLASAESVADIAAAVGLSPSRLRALVQVQTGTSPTHLRRWQRLRTAILSLPAKPIALAAIDAGFADQAHLTRTAVRLLGQTPGELARLLGNGQRRRHADVGPALAAAA
ncbi:MAG TPA: helix-turn-helix domain-containing protein [Jiangellaceae bacterium]